MTNEVDDILKERNLFYLPGNTSPEQGNLNTVIFVQDGSGRKFVFRMFRSDKREEIQSYLSNSYNAMGLRSYDVKVKYRDIDEQVSFMTRLKSKGIPVPTVRDYGDNWMLMEMVNGKPLKERLPGLRGRKSKLVVKNALAALMDAHIKGECLWDRWGANELVSLAGEINFIDFDIDLEWPERTSNQTKASFDLSVMIRACVQFSSSKTVAAQTICAFIQKSETFGYVYGVDALKYFFKGQVDYYNDAYCQNQNTTLEDKEAHQKINNAIIKIDVSLYSERTEILSLRRRYAAPKPI